MILELSSYTFRALRVWSDGTMCSYSISSERAVRERRMGVSEEFLSTLNDSVKKRKRKKALKKAKQKLREGKQKTLPSFDVHLT